MTRLDEEDRQDKEDRLDEEDRQDEEDKLDNVVVNACITRIVQLHGDSVTTVEGIGNSAAGGLHPVQVGTGSEGGGKVLKTLF